MGGVLSAIEKFLDRLSLTVTSWVCSDNIFPNKVIFGYIFVGNILSELTQEVIVTLSFSAYYVDNLSLILARKEKDNIHRYVY